MKIGLKLTLSFALTIVFLIILVLLGMQTMSSINDANDDIVKDKYTKTLWVNNIIDYNNANRVTL